MLGNRKLAVSVVVVLYICVLLSCFVLVSCALMECVAFVTKLVQMLYFPSRIEIVVFLLCLMVKSCSIAVCKFNLVFKC